jgi:hypothetical protein
LELVKILEAASVSLRQNGSPVHFVQAEARPALTDPHILDSVVGLVNLPVLCPPQATVSA